MDAVPTGVKSSKGLYCRFLKMWGYSEMAENGVMASTEPSAGADRGTLALLCEAYTPDESRASKVFMKFAPRMAPIKAGIFPLVNKDGMPEIGERLWRDLRRKWNVEFDEKQSIGKRYARMDEAGTPYCITIDFETLEDNAVTIRDRDTMAQERISLDQVQAWLAPRLLGC